MSAIRTFHLAVFLLSLLLTGCGKSDGKARKKPPPPSTNYTLGEVVSFGRGGHSDRYKRGGWGDTEKDFTWTNARSAKLSFTIADANQPLRLRMRLAGFTNPPTLNYQPVEVLVNDESIAEWDVSDAPADFIAVIPAEVANHEQLNVRLRIPEAASPTILAIGNDPRLLGVSCFELAITKAESEEAQLANQQYDAWDPKQSRVRTYALGTVVNLGVGGGGQRYKVSGWYPPEPGFAWTGKEPAVLEFSVPPAERPLRLKMKLAALVHPPLLPAQIAEVYVNNRKVADWVVSASAELEACIPAEAAKDGALRIEIRTPKATSPQQLDLGPESRVLGVRCEELMIVEAPDEESEPRPSPKSTSPRR